MFCNLPFAPTRKMPARRIDLGNLFYDRRRHAEGDPAWERSAGLDPSFSIVWRNLGIGWFNISRKSAKARTAYEKAFAAGDPGDGQLLFQARTNFKNGVARSRKDV